MQIELFDILDSELEKALRDEKHALKEALDNVSAAMKEYVKVSEESQNEKAEILEYATNLESSVFELTDFIKNLHIVLTAEKETAEQIKGMADIMKYMSVFVVSPSAIKMGMLKEVRERENAKS